MRRPLLLQAALVFVTTLALLIPRRYWDHLGK